MTADITEAANTAILAAAKSAREGLAGDEQRHGEADARQGAGAAELRQEYSSGLTAMPSRTASAEADSSPSGLPITRPVMIASSSG